jgi:hypothetical protein
MIFDTYITQTRIIYLKMFVQTYIKSFDTFIYIYFIFVHQLFSRLKGFWGFGVLGFWV